MSATASIISDTKDIVVSAKLWFYGQFANEKLAGKIVNEIHTQYNETQGKIQIQESLNKFSCSI